MVCSVQGVAYSLLTVVCSVYREVCSKASEGKEEAEFLLDGTPHCLTGEEEACSSSVHCAL